VTGERPAFYALERGGWRDLVTLLHVPYTAWHLSYVVVGGCLAATVSWGRLGLTVLAFALALGIGAHALDELRDRPLATSLPAWLLVVLAVTSVAGAAAIGVAVAATFSWWLLAFIAAGVLLVPAYNLELFGGRFHTDLWFALAWGGFPVLTGFFACTGRLELGAVVAAAWASLLSLAQRSLSTRARVLRRSTRAVTGTVELMDGTREPLTAAALLAGPETILRLLTWSTIMLAASLALVRLEI
jgi:hypothetical protein